jgi:glutamate/tyrosine decarboxylase-like PLP-dependent enzyme
VKSGLPTMSASSDELRIEQLRAFKEFFSRGPLQQPGATGGLPEAWFLGPKAENERVLRHLLIEALDWHVAFRKSFHPEDPSHVTDAIKQSPEYHIAIGELFKWSRTLFEQMHHSAPLFSMRYQSHMLWDQALPAVVGYIGAMLYNQNNVAAEASPVTTWLEINVGNELCRMLGFPVPPDSPPPPDTSEPPPPAGTPVPWGHITCDGSVANIEALWAARNAKFFAFALREALVNDTALAGAKNLRVLQLDGNSRCLREIDDPWTLLNLPIDSVVSLPQKIEDKYGIKVAVTTRALLPYVVSNIGLLKFYRRLPADIGTPVVMAPATRHYSWPKAATLLGLGQESIQSVNVDLQARMDVNDLKGKLLACKRAKQPVIAVVVVIGSTEESAVDPLRAVIDLREELREEYGLDFAIHCDAAWGGYFNSIRRPPAAGTRHHSLPAELPKDVDVQRLKFLARFAEIPTLPMSDYVNTQYAALAEADSITVDPHKAGYAPYPAGSVCYRNSAMRDLISLKAPVVFHSDLEPTVGIYGVEGSKPGAAAAGVWLAHKVIPLNQSGYGKILGQCMWTSKRMYCRLVTMQIRDADPNRRYRLVPFQMLPAERDGGSCAEVREQKETIARDFVNRSNVELLKFLEHNKAAGKLFSELGSDQVILAYTFNFKDRSGHWNSDPGRLATFNNEIFNVCSVTKPGQDVNSKLLILTSSQFDVDGYGKPFIQHYSKRLEIHNPDNAPIPFLISTTMDPWTTDTTKGDFLQVIEDALRTSVRQALKKMDSQ